MEYDSKGVKRPIGKGLKAYMGADYQLYRELLERVPENGEIGIWELAGITNRHPTPFIDQSVSSLFQCCLHMALSHHEIKWGSNINKLKRDYSFNKEQTDEHYWKPERG